MQAKAKGSPARQAVPVTESDTRHQQFRAGIDGLGIAPDDELEGLMVADNNPMQRKRPRPSAHAGEGRTQNPRNNPMQRRTARGR